MKRVLKRIPLGEGTARYLVTITGDPVMGGEIDMRTKQAQLLLILGSQPELLLCAGTPFDKLRMWFTGAEWAAELEAVGEDRGGPEKI